MKTYKERTEDVLVKIEQKKKVRSRIRGGIAAGLVLVLALVLFGHNLMELFSNTERILDLGAYGLRVLAVGYVAVGVSQVLSGALRGAGDTMPGMWISLITTVVIRVPLAYLLAYLTVSPEWPHGHPNAIFVSLLANWVIGAGLNAWAFFKRDWRSRSLMDELK